jgi:hypothetical protein
MPVFEALQLQREAASIEKRLRPYRTYILYLQSSLTLANPIGFSVLAGIVVVFNAIVLSGALNALAAFILFVTVAYLISLLASPEALVPEQAEDIKQASFSDIVDALAVVSLSVRSTYARYRHISKTRPNAIVAYNFVALIAGFWLASKISFPYILLIVSLASLATPPFVSRGGFELVHRAAGPYFDRARGRARQIYADAKQQAVAVATRAREAHASGVSAAALRASSAGQSPAPSRREFSELEGSDVADTECQ